MLYMLINRTHPNLSPQEFETLGRIARDFYAHIPAGLTLHGDWAANDGSCTFALIEAEDPALLEQIQAPFRDYVDIETVPVTRISGWTRT